VVSVEDHVDLARTHAGVGQARADAVWDGRRTVVVLSVRGVEGAGPSTSLVADLAAEVRAARDPATPVVVVPGELVTYDLAVDLEHDRAYLRADVEAAVAAALRAALGPGARDLARGVTAAEALLVTRSVPGVLACTMPRLLAAGTEPGSELLGALPGRLEPGHPLGPLRPAQLLALKTVRIGVMSA